MRTLEAIQKDIAALGRPVSPGAVGSLNPKTFAKWREEREAWRKANPGAEERYCLLLEEIEAVEDAMLREQKTRAVARASGIPRRTFDALATLKRLPVIESAEAWLDSPKAWLVMGGSVGTGKSVAAAHVLTRAIARGNSGAWTLAAGFATLVGGFKIW